MTTLGWEPALIWLIAVFLVLGTVAAICEQPARRRYHHWRYRRAQAWLDAHRPRPHNVITFHPASRRSHGG